MNTRLLGLAALAVAVPVYGWANDESSSFTDTYVDAVVVNSAIAESKKECLYNLYNMFGNAAADGLVVNGARTGLGTTAPAGKRLETDSLYYQAIRIFSYFDWELGRQLRLESQGRCLPEDISVATGVFNQRYVSKLPKPFPEKVQQVQRALTIALPGSSKIDMIRVDQDATLLWPFGTHFSPTHKAELREGMLSKLKYIEQTAAQNTDIQKKLGAMLMSMSPLALTVNAHIPSNDPSQAKLYVEGYLPPIHEVDIPDVDRAETWSMKRGLTKTELPRPVDISIIKLTHVGYLTDSPADAIPLIKLQLFKDFSTPDIIQTRITFGRVSDQPSDGEAMPVRYDDYRDAFIVSFRPNLVISPNDLSAVRAVKDRFNRWANGYQIDARIHHLNISLERASVPSPAAFDRTDPILKPRYSMKDSGISFRVHHDALSQTERSTLQALGFDCAATYALQTWRCRRDFGTYSELETFMDDDSGAASVDGFGHALQNAMTRAFNALVSVNTKLVIDANIRGIEDAIDEQFVQILEDAMKKQDDARQKIRERLERAVF